MQSFRQVKQIRRDIHSKVERERQLFDDTKVFARSPKPSDSLSNIGNEKLENQSESNAGNSTTLAENSMASPSFSGRLAASIGGISAQDPDEKGEPRSFLVAEDPSDDCSPRIWPMAKRILATLIIFWIVFVCGWASSANSSSNARAAAEFHVSKEAESLATALFLFGNAIGALASGPISETAGRNPSYLIFLFLHMIMVLITALAPNFAVQLVFRFLSGLFASPPLTIYGGSLADMFDNVERSLVWPLFAISPILGPILAPVAGGWLVQSTAISWRWVNWVTLIISSFVFLIALLFLPETFSPMILQWKAEALRKETGDPRFKSQHELRDPLWTRLRGNITRPLIFFVQEPIVIFVGFYLTLIYVLVFTFLDGFTFIFVDIYGFSEGLRGTVFLAISVGVILNVLTMPLFRRNYLKHLREAKEEQEVTGPDDEAVLEPEVRLCPAIFCAPLFPISLFWMGWTNYTSISPWSDIGAACLFGFSLMGVFVSSYQYVIDSYETNSASVLSSITFLRYIIAGGMVIADMPMYKAIGVHWTLTLMGCLATGLVPVPFVFRRYGRQIRSKSKFVKNFD